MDAFPVYICESSGRFVDDCDIVQCEYSHRVVEKPAVLVEALVEALLVAENDPAESPGNYRQIAKWLLKRLGLPCLPEEHHWIDIRNEAVESGEMCLHCRTVRPS
jgi:hypothetical protein